MNIIAIVDIIMRLWKVSRDRIGNDVLSRNVWVKALEDLKKCASPAKKGGTFLNIVASGNILAAGSTGDYLPLKEAGAAWSKYEVFQRGFSMKGGVRIRSILPVSHATFVAEVDKMIQEARANYGTFRQQQLDEEARQKKESNERSDRVAEECAERARRTRERLAAIGSEATYDTDQGVVRLGKESLRRNFYSGQWEAGSYASDRLLELERRLNEK